MKLLILFSLWFNNPSKTDLITLRNLFPLVGKQESFTSQMLLLSRTSSSTNQNLKIAYEGVAYMAYAKHKINPYSKYKSFIDGRNLLELAIRQDSENIEIRFVRFIIQKHTPSFLGYKQNIKTDKLYILKNLNKLKATDTDLFARIYAYLISGNCINDEEKKLLEGKEAA